MAAMDRIKNNLIKQLYEVYDHSTHRKVKTITCIFNLIENFDTSKVISTELMKYSMLRKVTQTINFHELGAGRDSAGGSVWVRRRKMM